MDSPLVGMLVIKMTINLDAFSLLMKHFIVSDVNSTSFVTAEWGWMHNNIFLSFETPKYFISYAWHGYEYWIWNHFIKSSTWFLSMQFMYDVDYFTCHIACMTLRCVSNFHTWWDCHRCEASHLNASAVLGFFLVFFHHFLLANILRLLASILFLGWWCWSDFVIGDVLLLKIFIISLNYFYRAFLNM